MNLELRAGHASTNSLTIKDNPYDQKAKETQLKTERINQSQATFADANMKSHHSSTEDILANAT